MNHLELFEDLLLPTEEHSWLLAPRFWPTANNANQTPKNQDHVCRRDPPDDCRRVYASDEMLCENSLFPPWPLVPSWWPLDEVAPDWWLTTSEDFIKTGRHFISIDKKPRRTCSCSWPRRAHGPWRGPAACGLVGGCRQRDGCLFLMCLGKLFNCLGKRRIIVGEHRVW